MRNRAGDYGVLSISPVSHTSWPDAPKCKSLKFRFQRGETTFANVTGVARRLC